VRPIQLTALTLRRHVRKCEDVEQLNSTLVPPLLEAILSDYQANLAAARDAEVLNVLTTIVTRLGSLLLPRVADILRAVFECTLEMISKDFTEYPEHRVGFYKLLRALNLNCFTALLQLEPAQFKLLIDSLLWGIKVRLRCTGELTRSSTPPATSPIPPCSSCSSSSATVRRAALAVLIPQSPRPMRRRPPASSARTTSAYSRTPSTSCPIPTTGRRSRTRCVGKAK